MSQMYRRAGSSAKRALARRAVDQGHNPRTGRGEDRGRPEDRSTVGHQGTRPIPCAPARSRGARPGERTLPVAERVDRRKGSRNQPIRDRHRLLASKLGAVPPVGPPAREGDRACRHPGVRRHVHDREASSTQDLAQEGGSLGRTPSIRPGGTGLRRRTPCRGWRSVRVPGRHSAMGLSGRAGQRPPRSRRSSRRGVR